LRYRALRLREAFQMGQASTPLRITRKPTRRTLGGSRRIPIQILPYRPAVHLCVDLRPFVLAVIVASYTLETQRLAGMFAPARRIFRQRRSMHASQIDVKKSPVESAANHPCGQTSSQV
jgi:hypothetical protein